MGVENLAGTLYLDSNIIIYLVEQEPRYYPLLSSLLARANSGQIQLVSSELAILECLVIPLRNQDAELVDDYHNILLASDLRLVPVSLEILYEAARLRAAHPRLRIPDAIHWSAASLAHADHLLTNDADFLRLLGAFGIGLNELLP
jgi:predicted nucleic acid-binding protein